MLELEFLRSALSSCLTMTDVNGQIGLLQECIQKIHHMTQVILGVEQFLHWLFNHIAGWVGASVISAPQPPYPSIHHQLQRRLGHGEQRHTDLRCSTGAASTTIEGSLNTSSTRHMPKAASSSALPTDAPEA